VCQTRGRGGNQDTVWCPGGIPASACSCQSCTDLPSVWKAQQEADSLSAAAATAGCGAQLPAAPEGCSFHGCRNSSSPGPPSTHPPCLSSAMARLSDDKQKGTAMAPWFPCHLQPGWGEGWELTMLPASLLNTQAVLLHQALGRRQPHGREGG